MIRLGGHGLPVGSDDVFAFAKAHVDFGYAAAYCPPVEIGDAQRLGDIEKAFKAVDVTIAEVAIWRNLISPDAAERKKNMAFAAERLAVADAVGANCAVSYIGSLAPGSDYGPAAANFTREGFDAAVEAVRELARYGQAQARQVRARDDAVRAARQHQLLHRADPRDRPADVRRRISTRST